MDDPVVTVRSLFVPPSAADVASIAAAAALPIPIPIPLLPSAAARKISANRSSPSFPGFNGFLLKLLPLPVYEYVFMTIGGE